MAYEIPPAPGGQIIGTHLAAADLSPLGATPSQYRGVKQDAAGAIVRCTVLGEMPFGVLQNRPTAGRACTIWRTGGVTKMEAGAAIALGVRVAVDAQGRAITAISTYNIIGRAEIAAGAAGEVISVSLSPEGVMP